MHVSWIKSPENESSERTEHTGFVQFISWIVTKEGEKRSKKNSTGTK